MSGGRVLGETLKGLPKRQFAIKSGSYPVQLVDAPTVMIPKGDFTELLERSIRRHARLRSDIERDIQSRVPVTSKVSTESLDEWE